MTKDYFINNVLPALIMGAGLGFVGYLIGLSLR